MCVRSRPPAVFYISEELFGFSCSIAVKCEMHEMFQQKKKKKKRVTYLPVTSVIRECLLFK